MNRGLPEVSPFGHGRRKEVQHLIENRGWTIRGHHHLPMGRLKKIVFHRPVGQGEQAIVVTQYVHQPASFALQPELRPSKHFKEFFKRAEAARQRDKGAGQFRHHGFPFVHGLHDVKFRQSPVGQFLVAQSLRYHPRDRAARGQTCIRQSAHQSDVASAINQTELPLGEQRSHFFRNAPIFGPAAKTRATENTDRLDHSLGAIPSAFILRYKLLRSNPSNSAVLLTLPFASSSFLRIYSRSAAERTSWRLPTRSGRRSKTARRAGFSGTWRESMRICGFIITMRSMRFRNSLTLPGHAYSCNTWYASG